ncbi:MAG: methylmalonyl Co-A mutase-associated GTPase MeaB [Candidatus Mcinerneyibacterium aminivorans]|jgi:LAO/AO transport system kinase|uniref:Methylmalonyl Co-A mutase-associated GTPase MeaB n=1 Tax=Candidatus Mcinerneyibacterium aminivorans TaxID=2703815 RepID=A0A5D0MEU3_9BACT|nr:MAG: methylmalonyl Co-A mutase-associated GTPase MeaB [Candidatus Mcinerneyibacterium aminivorans]
MDIENKILEGSPRHLARAISMVENNSPQKEEIIDALYPKTGNALIIGVTGSPGSGKSTLVDKILKNELKKDQKIGVIAVDPSSPFSGGALLGDRIRMQKHSGNPNIFIRSMASRGHLGGISAATSDVTKLLDAAGYNLIIIETIGVGQTEVEIIELADIILLTMAPGMGDDIQAMKAGIMEIGDVFVVNKKDKDGADKVKKELDYVLDIKYHDNPENKNPIKMVSALNNEGIEELMNSVYNYINKLKKQGKWEDKRKTKIKKELKKIFSKKIHELMDIHINYTEKLDDWVKLLMNKEEKPYSLINKELKSFIKESEIL